MRWQHHHDMEEHARFGYILERDMPRVLKRKDFARWQAGEGLPDSSLCKAVAEMASGLIDADLGGSSYKKRIARPGSEKAAAITLYYRKESAIATYSCTDSRKATRQTSHRPRNQHCNFLVESFSN